MKCPPVLEDETERLRALAQYGLGPERALPSLDPVVQIAARAFAAPVAAVNMIGNDHVFFAASRGTDSDVDMSRDVSFCAHAIAQDEVLVVPDATTDERFHDNPLVTRPNGIRFYAGVPLRSPGGHALGALCVIDSVPRHDFSHDERLRLRELAQMAADRLELRRVEISTEQVRLPFVSFDRLADTDPLTALANRSNFYRRMEACLVAAPTAAILMVDLDGFKDVNDTLGHQVGDGILSEVANRLRQASAPGDVVARMGGDEFAIFMPGVSSPDEASERARRLVMRLAESIVVDGHDVRVAASCGVAVAPTHAQEALELVGNADLALFRAKKLGRGQVCVFVPALRMEAVARRLYNIELHRAVADGQLVLFYQPQVRLSDGTITGAEALLRWQHPQRGLLSPAAFLPALEGGPLAAVVGAWVLDEACAQAAYWRRQGAGDLRMGVNLFGAQFRLDDLVTEVASALRRHGLPPGLLELEVTENIVLDHDDQVLDALARLRAMGVGIAFDDFGTGYASLSLLKRYPLSRIKIDRSFVHHLHESDRDASVVRAILDMARGFGLETVAEGVENEAQRDRLRGFGCEEAQGYLFGRPVPVAAFPIRLDSANGPVAAGA